MEHMEGMIDLGMKQEKMIPEENKNKIRYPTFSVNKNLNLKMGQRVLLEGIISGITNQKDYKSTSFEVKGYKLMGEKSKSDKPDKNWDTKDIMKYRRDHEKE